MVTKAGATGIVIGLATLLLALPATAATNLFEDLNHIRAHSLNEAFQAQQEQLEKLRLEQPISQTNGTAPDEPTQLQQLRNPNELTQLTAEISRCESVIASESTRIVAPEASPRPTVVAVGDATTTCPDPANDTLPTGRLNLYYNIKKWWSEARQALIVTERAKQEALQARVSTLRCNIVNCVRAANTACADRVYTDLEKVIEDYQVAARRTGDPAAAEQSDTFSACALRVDFTLTEEPIQSSPAPSRPSGGGSTDTAADELIPAIFGQPDASPLPIPTPASGAYNGGLLRSLFYGEPVPTTSESYGNAPQQTPASYGYGYEPQETDAP